MKKESQVTVISAIMVVIIFVIKIITSIFVKSVSFNTELSDSILDLLQVLMTYTALKLSAKPPDDEYMFGHSKINSLAGFVESLMIIGLYCGVGYIAIRKMITQPDYQPQRGWIGALSLGITLIGVFIVSQKIVKIGRNTQNKAIIAQGLNFRADLYRNIAVIISLIITALTNFGIIDLIFATFVSIYAIYNGLKLLKDSTKELLDANALADELIQDLKNQIQEIPQILHIDHIAIRTVSNELDARIAVSIPKNTDGEIIETISRQIKQIFTGSFSHMQINTNIQFNLDIVKAKLQYKENLFDLLRNIPVINYDLANLHNIIIDDFPEKILIQFTIQVESDITIQEGHEKSSQLEAHIKEQIQNLIPEKSIEIITHLETNKIQQKKHTDFNRKKISTDLIQIIENRIKSEDLRITLKNSWIQPAKSGIELILTLGYPAHLTFEYVEKSMDEIEQALYKSKMHITRILINPEPIEN